MKDEDLDAAVRKIPDFPKKGILFFDITGILTNPVAFRYCIDRMEQIYKGTGITAVAAIEARGFLFAAPFAERVGLPLILVRKSGKLPGDVYRQSYELEYGSASIEIHKMDIPKDGNILLVDDLVATGNTLLAAKNLLEQGGAMVKNVFGVIGLPFLQFRKKLPSVSVNILIEYHDERA